MNVSCGQVYMEASLRLKFSLGFELCLKNFVLMAQVKACQDEIKPSSPLWSAVVTSPFADGLWTRSLTWLYNQLSAGHVTGL